jgi:tetratricopeptide (TPR) repeat protein
LQDVLAGEPAHAGALGLLVETSTALERWDVAVSALRRLAEAPVPLAQQRVARLGAAEFLERRIGDVNAACAELQALDAAGIQDQAVLMRLGELCERSGQYRNAVDAYQRAAQEAPGAAAAELELRAGDVLRDRLGAQNEALIAYQRALAANALNADVCARLLDLLPEGDERQRLIEGFERAVRGALEREPARADLLRLLARTARWSQRGDVELTALGALSALRAATEEELQTVLQLDRSAHARVFRPSAEETLRRVGAGALNAPLARAAQLASSALAAFEGPTAPPLTLDAELAIAITAEQRVALGRRWLARALGVAALASRTRAAQREALHACLSFSGGEPATPAIDELGKRIGKQLSRAQRKELARVLGALEAPIVQIEAYLDVLDASLARAGLLLGDDLGAAWAHGSGDRAELDSLVSSPRQLDLLRFWLSPRFLDLRRELGWGP